ncbi:hypothetical protein FRB94_009307 [Tulasnella sp. JGI-2019a]|nr:hypothetical protein FRB94_009307 [Tulasnella sp. JGI-2019a]
MDTKDSPPQYDRGNTDLKVPLTDEQRLSIEDEHRPLPEGWVRQLDPNSSHHFYVDTLATPPRSIWVHPYEDSQWQQEHAQRLGPTPSSPVPSAAASAATGEDERPLPDGWVKRFDDNNKRHFYVDTRATPPRSIWVHPHDDPQWQQEHHGQRSGPPSPRPPPAVGGRSSPPPPEKRPAPTKESSGDGLMGALAGGGVLAGGLALLGKYMESKNSTPTPTPTPAPPPPQHNYPTQPAGPAHQAGPPVYPSQAYAPGYEGGRRHSLERHGLLGLGSRREDREERRDDRRAAKDERRLLREEAKIERRRMKEMRRQQEHDMKHGYIERRRLVDGGGGGFGGQPIQYPNTPMYSDYGYRGGPAYPPPQMAYGRHRTGYGGRGGGGGMGMLGGLAGGMLLGDMIGGDGGDDGGGDDGGGDDGGDGGD